MLDPKKPLLTRRNLIILFAGLTLGYICLWGVLTLGYRFSDRNRINRVQQVSKAYLESLASESRAIKKAETYLESNISSVKPANRFMLDYLQRTYGLDPSLAIHDYQISQDSRTYPQELHYMERIARPEKIVSALPQGVDTGISFTNIYSAHCDKIALPANFWDVMEQNVGAGGYYATHNALALTFLKNNNCAVPASHQSLEERVVDVMVDLASDTNTNADLRYEAIAFMQLLGHKDKVKQEWINQIVKEQGENGSWQHPEDSKNNDHTTILALWALLGYSRKDVSDQPLIRH